MKLPEGYKLGHLSCFFCEELIDEKKSSIETSIIENEKKKVVDLIMEVKKNKILRGFGNLAESGLKKIGLK